MKEYYIEWRIELSAKSPRDAAKQALKIQRDPFSSSTVFHVATEDKGEFEIIDLEELEEEESWNSTLSNEKVVMD